VSRWERGLYSPDHYGGKNSVSSLGCHLRNLALSNLQRSRTSPPKEEVLKLLAPLKNLHNLSQCSIWMDTTLFSLFFPMVFLMLSLSKSGSKPQSLLVHTLNNMVSLVEEMLLHKSIQVKEEIS
jgi:hypothetical protein